MDFVHKIGVAEKEAAETIYWREICGETNLGNKGAIGDLFKEAGELRQF